MKAINRRSFMKNSAVVTGALAFGQMSPGQWLSFAYAEPTGYFESQFGITDALCKRVLDQALSKGGDFADLYFEHTISNWLNLEDDRVDRAYGSIKLGVGIRTVKGNQVGYGFTQEMDEKSLLAAATTAATIANSSGKSAAKKYVELKTPNYYPLETLLTDVPLESKLSLVQKVNKKCVNLSDLIIKVSAGFHDSQKRIMIVTSDGIKAEDIQPRNFLYSSVVAEKDGKKERASWNFGGRHDFSYYTNKVANGVAEEAVQRALVLFDAIQPPAGEMPVVLGPGITGILLHEAIGHGLEADFNRKKISTYSNMMGKKIAEPFVTIIDNGTNINQLGALNVDDEGVLSKKTVLVENGILKSYLHDKISAQHYHVEPTGNGRRESYEHYPQPRMRNTYMLSGEHHPDEVIKSAKKGIYVEGVSNGEVKIGEGDFSFYVSQGRMIEDGKLTAPIKDVNIMGNGPEMLKNIKMVAHDLKFSEGGMGACGKGGQAVPVSFGLPTCLVKSMTVGGLQKQGA